MLEYNMVPDEGREVLAVRRAIEALGWRTGWDMQQDIVFGWVEWLLVAENEAGQKAEVRRRLTHAELRAAADTGGFCRQHVERGWRDILAEVELVAT